MPETELSAAIETLLQRGGWVMAVLLAFSLAAVTIFLAKLLQFARLRIWSRSWISETVEWVRAGRIEEALARTRETAGPVAAVLRIAIEERARRDLSEEALREEVRRAGEAELGALESNLRGLEVIASLAPLLGLLGTVLGMIRAFMRLEEAGARVDPGLLSGGIWEALLTTAVGIAVAIPAMAALAWLESQVDRVRRTLGDAVTRVLNAPRAQDPKGTAAAEETPSPLRTAGSSRAL